MSGFDWDISGHLIMWVEVLAVREKMSLGCMEIEGWDASAFLEYVCICVAIESGRKNRPHAEGDVFLHYVAAFPEGRCCDEEHDREESEGVEVVMKGAAHGGNRTA